MREPKVGSASARVKIVMDVPVDSSWAGDCSLSQIFRQAGDETVNHVTNVLLKGGLRVKIISAKVTAVSAIEEEK